MSPAIRDAQEGRAQGALEAKLLAALEKAPEEMRHDDWEQLRARVRHSARDLASILGPEDV